MHLSVIIPAYNEEKRLPKTLAEIDRYLFSKPYEYEILVVNNASTDRTAEAVKGLEPKIKGLKLVEGSGGKGKGYAVYKGMVSAVGKYRIFTDADNSTSIDQVEKMWPEFEKGVDIVIGSRDVRGAEIAVSQPMWRVMLGDTFNLIVQVVSGLWGIKDTQCGFKGFTERAANDIFPRITIYGWAFDVELLILARISGYKFKEIPVRWVNDPESKVKFGGMIKMLFEVLKIRINLMTGAYSAVKH